MACKQVWRAPLRPLRQSSLATALWHLSWNLDVRCVRQAPRVGESGSTSVCNKPLVSRAVAAAWPGQWHVAITPTSQPSSWVISAHRTACPDVAQCIVVVAAASYVGSVAQAIRGCPGRLMSHEDQVVPAAWGGPWHGTPRCVAAQDACPTVHSRLPPWPRREEL